MLSLDIDLLRVFVAIAEETSFTGAGRRLYRTQSTVSLQLKRLERQLDKKLIQRVQGRVIGLTETGENLLDYAYRIIRANDEAAVAIGKPRLSGAVRLGLPDETAQTAISQALLAFRSRHPSVRLEITCRLSEELENLIERGQLDLALINRCDPAAALCPEHLYTEPLSWVTSKSLSWIPNQPIPLVGFPSGCAYRVRALTALEEAGIEWIEVYTSTSHYGVREAVTSGLGVAALPMTSIPRQGGTNIIHLELPELGDVEVMMTGTLSRETETVKCLRDHIRTQISFQHDARMPESAKAM
jgi:DNA-binding transcriptional LysR family regulator